MAHTIPAMEVSDDEILAYKKAVEPYLAQINNTPELLSMLYDLDLLPEQIRYAANASRMIAICELMQQRDEARAGKIISNG